ncbi:MAG: hypothetical protein LBB51_01730 [Zoogloeaceae bacterium]|jgi:hypothetical protein|nr:hypothetical protein [Zoogloeaceae bacterium]
MIVQSTSAIFSTAEIARSLTPRQIPNTSPENIADIVSISEAAREALAASNASSSFSSSAANDDESVEARLAEIRTRGPVNRSREEHDFLFANDRRLAEITAQGKSPDQLTADEIDYMQKATGLVNTFANLSPAEKALYDKAVASGNAEAAAGISQIAFIRMGHTAGDANGATYDPLDTEITAANIEKYFSHSIIDPSGKAQSRFQALIQFLQNELS